MILAAFVFDLFSIAEYPTLSTKGLRHCVLFVSAEKDGYALARDSIMQGLIWAKHWICLDTSNDKPKWIILREYNFYLLVGLHNS